MKYWIDLQPDHFSLREKETGDTLLKARYEEAGIVENDPCYQAKIEKFLEEKIPGEGLLDYEIR